LVAVAKNLKLFWFLLLAYCVGKKPKVLKGAMGFRFVANVLRYAVVAHL